jgi:hypothetical protein
MNTDFLFVRPSLWSGIARLFDFWGLYDEYNSSPTAAQADALALAVDWNIVGEDLARVMTKAS